MTWAIFDYGVGNLHSLAKALAAAGAVVEITTNPETLRNSRVAVLPGVGAFGSVMERLAPATKALQERQREGRPILGICIGQQVLYGSSAESPGVAGLGLLPGTVKRLPREAGKVPHMGWNQLNVAAPTALFDGVSPGAFVYYVHSYASAPDKHTVATTRYGTVFTAALRCGNTVGIQFHPEKSSAVGATVLRNAVQLLEAQA